MDVGGSINLSVKCLVQNPFVIKVMASCPFLYNIINLPLLSYHRMTRST